MNVFDNSSTTCNVRQAVEVPRTKCSVQKNKCQITTPLSTCVTVICIVSGIIFKTHAKPLSQLSLSSGSQLPPRSRTILNPIQKQAAAENLMPVTFDHDEKWSQQIEEQLLEAGDEQVFTVCQMSNLKSDISENKNKVETSLKCVFGKTLVSLRDLLNPIVEKQESEDYRDW